MAKSEPNLAIKYAFFEGKIVPVEDAKVSIMTNALQYGTGVFGGIRGYYNEKKKAVSIFRINDHFTRLKKSLNILGVGFDYSVEELVEFTKELVAKNAIASDVYLRPFAYAASTKLSPNLNAEGKFAFAMYQIPLQDYIDTKNGISAKVSSWQRISDNMIPARAKVTGGYINSAMARKEAADDGYDEAIFLTDKGYVAEGSAENIFIVRNGKLITPGKSSNILEGITRASVMELATDIGVEVEERDISRTELYVADEAFFTGTGAQIAWISKIDKRSVGTGKRGPITTKISDLFFSSVHGQNPEKYKWCTFIDIK